MRVFISYRRTDGVAYVLKNLKDQIDWHFGAGTAFYDIDTIPIGTDFKQYIISHLEEASIVLVFVGDQWLGEGKNGERRIDSATDFVRLEIETALAKGLPIVPVFAGSADYKILEGIPESIGSLRFRNGLELRAGPDQEAQTLRLIRRLKDFANQNGIHFVDKNKEARPGKKVAGDRGENSAVDVHGMTCIDEGKAGGGSRGEFEVVLGKTYLRTGYINPGPYASRLLGDHGEAVSIVLGDSRQEVLSKINRTANANGLVRIVGNNAKIAEWFQQNYTLGDTVKCRVTGKNSVVLGAEPFPDA